MSKVPRISIDLKNAEANSSLLEALELLATLLNRYPNRLLNASRTSSSLFRSISSKSLTASFAFFYKMIVFTLDFLITPKCMPNYLL